MGRGGDGGLARHLAELLWAPQLPTLVQSCGRAGRAALGKARERIFFFQLLSFGFVSSSSGSGACGPQRESQQVAG